MARPRSPPDLLDAARVQVGLSPLELARLDRRRGSRPRSRYLREEAGIEAPYDLRALTVRQPWATLLARGRKPWENRPRDPGIRPGGQWVAIHAACQLHAALDWARELAPDLDPHACPLGAIVGLAWLEPAVPLAQVRADRKWACGPACIPVSQALELGPIPCRGQLGLWRVSVGVRERIEAQVGPL